MNGLPSERMNGLSVFRLLVLATCLGEMAVYYDTSEKTIPYINYYLLGNIVLILLALAPWKRATQALWWLVWPAGALLHLDWATRPTNSDVFWATSQGVDFLLRGLNPYTQTYTWVYQHQPGISNYPSYSYFPGGLFAEVPFYLLGNVRLGLALADITTAVLVYLVARKALGEWAGRGITAAWLLFVPLFAIPMLLGALDFILLFWVAFAVWLYLRGAHLGSALAAAMVFGTKQYGFLFAIPWGLLLLRPITEEILARRRSGAGMSGIAAVAKRAWLPPAVLAMVSVLVAAPLALLSPKAFLDATVQFHAKQLPVPALGTPQWNESLAGQLAALGWVKPEVAQPVAAALLGALILAILVVAVFKIKDAASALVWSAVLSGVSFAFNSGRVHFFYWRLTLLLFLLYVLVSFLPSGRTIVHQEEAVARADAGKPGPVTVA